MPPQTRAFREGIPGARATFAEMPWNVIFWVLTIIYFNVVLHMLYKQYRRGLKDPANLQSHTFHLRIGLTFLSFLVWAVLLALYLT